jgi:hypothetical protein
MADELTHLKTLRTTNQRRLQILEQQADQLGVFVPPYIKIEIEDVQAKIKSLDEQIAALEGGSSVQEATRQAESQRCKDLAGLIRDAQFLLRGYEEKHLLQDDPKGSLSAEKSIADVRSKLVGYQAEARRLGCADR